MIKIESTVTDALVAECKKWLLLIAKARSFDSPKNDVDAHAKVLANYLVKCKNEGVCCNFPR